MYIEETRDSDPNPSVVIKLHVFSLEHALSLFLRRAHVKKKKKHLADHPSGLSVSYMTNSQSKHLLYVHFQ